jgi:uncharacterized protein YfaT (DUF1175 family)
MLAALQRRCPLPVLLAAALAVAAAVPSAQHPLDPPALTDGADRAAFRAWFLALADAQFYRPTPDVTDCSSLVRHAVREALRPHNTDWWRRLGVEGLPSYPDVRRPPPANGPAWRLFTVAPGERGEFADARTLVSLNASGVSRDTTAARPGDLLYYRHAGAADHLMVYVGPSVFDTTAGDWVVYHTGPDGSREGEVRKVRLADLRRHPVPRWRPLEGNPAFAGVFRLSYL